MTEDQIIAEAVRLAESEAHESYLIYERAIARHALRLATQPEQDPALVKATAVWKDAWAVWVAAEAGDDDPDHKAAARVIMDAYHAPSAEAMQWAIDALSTPNTFVGQRDAARLISVWQTTPSQRQERSNERVD